MTSVGDEEADAVLSDVEGEEPIPIPIKDQEEVSGERFKELLAELDREKLAREAAENSKSELQVQFNRLKALAHEAIRKRDESGRQRDDALREKEKTLKELEEGNRIRGEAEKQLEEAARTRDALKSEIDNCAHMLVSGIEKISGKVSNFKNFAGGGLPKSNKYTGHASVAYGVIKRTNEIVEELLRQIETTAKSRNEARDQIEHRNYEIAIEVSQLEASISGLREEVAKKSSAVEDLEKNVVEKDGKIAEMERENMEKVSLLESEAQELRQLVGEYEDKLKSLESKIESQHPLLLNQLNLVSTIHDRMYDVIKMVDGGNLDRSELSESFFMPQETGLEENIRASLAGMDSIHELTKIAAGKTKDFVEERTREVKNLNETVSLLVKEKEQIGSLLRSALSKRMALDSSSQKSKLFEAAENGLREVGLDFKFSKLLEEGKVPAASNDKADALDAEDDEIYTLAGTLENIIKESQLEIIELRHSVEELRAESSLLKEHVESQAKELGHRMHRVEELEEKERIANESVEGLMMDIAAAEEEITRWKVAAEQEAAAGRAIEQEYVSQLSAIKKELEEAKQAVSESEKKLKFKEETAAAAMAARDAAEKSLALADLRSTRLRERVEELNHKLEVFESREDTRGLNGARYACWPWQWLGMDLVGIRKPNHTQEQSSNEMELSEPFI